MTPTETQTGPAAAASTPRLSVIVVVYDMQREARRTLRSLTRGFQHGMSESEYEVVVVDNGSPTPLGEEVVRHMGDNFKYIYVENASASPAAAVNLGAAQSRGDILGVLVDGARIASPGLLKTVLHAFSLGKEPVVATLGWHLGPLSQQQSIPLGYDQAVEDELLASVGWPESDYLLFTISAFAQSSRYGFFTIPAESNGIFVSRKLFSDCDGYDEAFNLPGGGFVNHDFFRRAVERPGISLIVPLAEGTFHQVHGGISTNAARKDLDSMVRIWNEDYAKLRGYEYETPKVPAVYLGPVRPEQERLFLHSIRCQYHSRWRQTAEVARACIVIGVMRLRSNVKRIAFGAARKMFRLMPMGQVYRSKFRDAFNRYFHWLYSNK